MNRQLQSVKIGYYHYVIGFSDAESRLEGRKEGSYLLRESEIKAGIFIISHVKSSSVTHIFAPRIDGRYIRQSLEDH